MTEELKKEQYLPALKHKFKEKYARYAKSVDEGVCPICKNDIGSYYRILDGLESKRENLFKDKGKSHDVKIEDFSNLERNLRQHSRGSAHSYGCAFSGLRTHQILKNCYELVYKEFKDDDKDMNNFIDVIKTKILDDIYFNGKINDNTLEGDAMVLEGINGVDINMRYAINGKEFFHKEAIDVDSIRMYEVVDENKNKALEYVIRNSFNEFTSRIVLTFMVGEFLNIIKFNGNESIKILEKFGNFIKEKINK